VSEYMCSHGDLFMYCSICMDVQKAMEEYIVIPEESATSAQEYLYDYYLDLDEREMREQEDSL